MSFHRLTVLALALLALLNAPAVAAETWRVGVAKAPITPEKYMWMAGYASRQKVADSQQTELYAKAVVLEDARKQRAVLVTLDLIGIDADLALPLRRKIAEKHKLDLAQVMICCSHTHSGPVVAKNLRPMHYLVLDAAQRKLVDAYAQRLETTILQVVDVARMRLSPCEVAHGSGTCGWAVNRRNNKEADVPQLRERGELQGPNDHDVPVLAARNGAGELVAVVFGYACHATVLNGYAWSGDYPAYAQQAVEEKHPSAIALFWAGCGGDQNPIPRQKVELAEAYGRQLAASVNEVLASDMQPVAPQLSAQYAEIELPLARLPTRDELTAQANDKNIYIAARAKHYLAELDAGRTMPETYPYPLGVWQLGSEVEWIFLGGEVVVDYALRLKAERRDQRTWVAAYANDVMAYIPSRRVLTEGGYEGATSMIYYGLPTVWAETIEADIVRGLDKLRKPSEK